MDPGLVACISDSETVTVADYFEDWDFLLTPPSPSPPFRRNG